MGLCFYQFNALLPVKTFCPLNLRIRLVIHFRQDRAKAVEILVKDLKVFASFNEELFKEITQLLTLENFRYLLLDPSGWIFALLKLKRKKNDISFCVYAGKMSNFPSMETQNQLETSCFWNLKSSLKQIHCFVTSLLFRPSKLHD